MIYQKIPIVIYIFVCLIILILGCNGPSKSFQRELIRKPAGVFGSESRKRLSLNNPEIGFVGMTSGLGGHCSVGIVGVRAGVSNKHCFFDQKFESGKMVWTPKSFIEIDPNSPNHGWIREINGIRPNVLTHINDNTANYQFDMIELYWHSTQDIVVVSLSKNRNSGLGGKFPGEIFKTLDTCDLNFSIENAGVKHAGFSYDFTYGKNIGAAHIETGCSLKKGRGTQENTHNCDNSPGASGGPIWVDYKNHKCLLAVHSSERCSAENFDSKNQKCRIVDQNIGVNISLQIRQWLERLGSVGQQIDNQTQENVEQ